jgi:tetratricopeptide (TPR) repeat protein
VRNLWRVIGPAAVALAAIGGAAYFLWPRATAQQLLQQARRELVLGHLDRATTLSQQAYARDAREEWACIVAAECCMKSDRLDEALGWYDRVSRADAEASVAARFGAGEVLCHQGKLSESEALLREALAQNPDHVLSHYRLAFVLGLTGRRWESIPHLLRMIGAARFTADDLLVLGDVERPVDDRRLLEQSMRVAPDDPLPWLGLARLEIAANHLDEAERLLRRFVSVRPEEPEGQARLGALLLERSPGEYAAWAAAVPESADRHPEIWVVRGLHAERQGDTPTAIRCFAEAALRDPDHRRAMHHLGQSLQSAGQAEIAEPFLKRAEALGHLSIILTTLGHDATRVTEIRKAAGLCESLGRIWEVCGWSHLTVQLDPQQTWAQQALSHWLPRLTPELPRTLVEFNPAWQRGWSQYPLPARDLPLSDVRQPIKSHDGQSDIRFEDVAQRLGIDFVYFNSPEPETAGARIQETTGGGVAVIDLDGDARPDLYFTQGTHWPPDPSSTEFRDRCYLNRGAAGALDVTDRAGLGDALFSQGAGVGDLDHDGFADLYVANIGPNRVYHNNGDGTFEDVTRKSGVLDEAWTTSCALADVDGDGLADIYDVNYVGGANAFSRICERKGQPKSCSPRAFEAAPDRLWINRGDGTFADATDNAGIFHRDGYGLAIVAADFESTGRLNLFVANDEVPNFYFINRTSAPGMPRFEEAALAAGVATDGDGLSQACMGVAAGDADRDGRLDLFVTNFYHESNTLYLQKQRGLFTDGTRSAGLRDPSFAMLGFGTQFLDADLDGWEDLVVTNGHIDDLSAAGEPYRMRPQVFWNRGAGRFVELPAETVGEFFGGEYLGRGLARLDWNGDGREECAISHIGSPAALLVNRTARTGHFLTIALRGTALDRDAIGTLVTVSTNGTAWTKQLTAGDGYQASNERQLTFGLGSADRVEAIEIRWRSGQVQRFENPTVDRPYLAIEGRAGLAVLPVIDRE